MAEFGAFVRQRLGSARPPIARSPETAAFTDELLGSLVDGRYRARAWWDFWTRSWTRSVDLAHVRPRAAAETHALHGALLYATGDPRVAVSWLMTWSHLGLLPEGASLGVANVLTLLRANLPLLVRTRPRVAAGLALSTDLADGLVARRAHHETVFGAYADGIADAVFWIWFVRRYEPAGPLRAAAVALWVAPAAAVTVLAFARGRLPVAPRPNALRMLSAALQLVLFARALRAHGRARG